MVNEKSLGPEPPSDIEQVFPPVQPPDSSFFLQLFLLPAMIVCGIVLVWFLFGKLAGNDRSIEESIAIIRDPQRKDRWRAAHDLSLKLHVDSRHAKDPELAMLLTGALDAALDAPGDAEPALQEYLAGALGRLHLATGVPALLRAAGPNQHEKVRQAALWSLALLAERLGDLQDPNVSEKLLEFLQDEEPEIRERTAFTLGFLSDERACPALRATLDDNRRTVRYNAANALAMLGSDDAMSVHKEMLDLEEEDSQLLREWFVLEESDDTSEARVEGLVLSVMYSSMQSLQRLHRVNPQADFGPVIDSIERLTKHSNRRIQTKAKELNQRVKEVKSE